jgi:hypothetical protein
MGVRRCQVTIGPDDDGISHSTDVEAASFYEAAVVGIEALQRDGWTPTWITSQMDAETTVRLAESLRVATLAAPRSPSCPHGAR